MHVIFNTVHPRTKPCVKTVFRRWCMTRVRAFLVTSGKKRAYLDALRVNATLHEIEMFVNRCDERMAKRGVPSDVRGRLVARIRARVVAYLNDSEAHSRVHMESLHAACIMP